MRFVSPAATGDQHLLLSAAGECCAVGITIRVVVSNLFSFHDICFFILFFFLSLPGGHESQPLTGLHCLVINETLRPENLPPMICMTQERTIFTADASKKREREKEKETNKSFI
jgi:hypothetical protein